MEETGTNIHTGLVRRNNFLRENPISCKFVALCGETGAWRGFRDRPPLGNRNDTARTGA
ncbi:MAG: hypothetical protein PCALPYG88_4223 [uncultured Paraburkholderia sp.]|nr:MAG: hypothetical protein PCALPYG08_4626 [uncultured Paraburkholderia sp.]CAH2928539.1 MAG: hypothetical protein PCALPYG88_4223 [uncultured Paraburkholderia sp.]